MNVFFPFSKPANKFLEEIEPYFEGNFIFDNFSNWKEYKNISIINIHWPEKIFEWKEPSIEELNSFIEVFNEWKKEFIIVYTRHNIYPHYKKTKNFIKLYDFVANNVDAVIHFGNFSIKEFSDRYPNFNGKHRFIEHPLYLQKQKFIPKNEARNHLNIPLNAKVVLVFGYIRSQEEVKLILNSFYNVKTKNKLLFVSKRIKIKAPNWMYSYKIKKWYEHLINYSFNLSNGYKFGENNFVDDKELFFYLNATDVLLIPRIHLLNSGNLYLGFTFNKILIAPDIGNISEKIKNTKNISYNPLKKKSLTYAIEKGLSFKGESANLKNGLLTMDPKIIASKTLNFFNEISKK